MHKSSLGFSSIFLCLLAGSAVAQEPFIQGVYLSSQELCQQAKSGSLDSIIADGNVVLTAKGLKGTDYNCRFLQVLKSDDPHGWVATTLCKEPSGSYPDLLSITEDKPETLTVVSVYGDSDTEDDAGDDASTDEGAAAGQDSGGDDDGSGAASGDDSGEGSADDVSDTGVYYHCEGVAAP